MGQNNSYRGNLNTLHNLYKRRVLPLSILCIVMACSNKLGNNKTIVIKNQLKNDRSFETVALNKELLSITQPLEYFYILDAETNEIQVSQLIDEDGDGVYESLLFQPKISGFSEKEYEVVFDSNGNSNKWDMRCYSRFVPERTDDYAWENNKVAFRTFGPSAQKMVEQGIPGGTLTSGIDAWLKKVEYPIIDKWYEETLSGKGSYHKDTGEGLDNFHVGASRGVGGVAIKENGSYHFSKNFVSWKTISNGPIRTSFELTYDDWYAEDKVIRETQRISLDYGSNLAKYEILIHGTDRISAGLTLHENDGFVTANAVKGYLSYWQPHEDSELGMAIVIPKVYYEGYEIYETKETDLSNVYGHLKVIDNRVVYYAGFGWKESGQFKIRNDWENYLSAFVEKISTPLVVEVK
ncbi:DUF4861 family protein [Muricauda sp. ANG21]|uniref:DUF4861 family protein n=1 Tax=Allomuricauda sp. ANG21 TaxID=3042468 RepID=UPI003453CFAB